jgi:hypothetical protein
MAQQISSTRSMQRTGSESSQCQGSVRCDRLVLRLPNRLARTALGAAVLSVALSARAVDGCLVLLCLAAPSWSSIAQCVPPIQSLLNDLAHGRPFPTCDMAGAGNAASNQDASAPAFCPAQYTTAFDLEAGTRFECRFNGAISTTIDGALWTRTWWSFAGETVTEYTPVAKAALGSFDTRYDDDYAAWLATQAPAAPACPAC